MNENDTPPPAPPSDAPTAKPRHVLFVCTGNTCRSAMGEFLLRHAIKGKPEPLGSLHVRSAGLMDSGNPASATTVRVLWAVGIDASRHRSQTLNHDLVANALAIFAMEDYHADAVRRVFPNLKTPLRLLREFAPDADPQKPENLCDPYGGSLEDYVECRDNIVETIPGILKFLEELLSEQNA